MPEQTRRPRSHEAAALWVAGAVLVAAGAIAAAQQAPINELAGTSLSAASAGMSSNGNSNKCNGNNGNGNGNNCDGNNNGNGNNGGTGATPPAKKLVVTGSVAGLVAPGLPAVLTVKVDNPNNQPVNLKSVTGSVSSVTSAGGATPVCDKAWYSIGSFTGSQPIPKNASHTLQLPVTFTNLPAVNQDNCKGATYTFTFTANADQA